MSDFFIREDRKVTKKLSKQDSYLLALTQNVSKEQMSDFNDIDSSLLTEIYNYVNSFYEPIKQVNKGSYIVNAEKVKVLKSLTKKVCLKGTISIFSKVKVTCKDNVLSFIGMNADDTFQIDFEVSSNDFEVLIDKEYIDLLPKTIDNVEYNDNKLIIDNTIIAVAKEDVSKFPVIKLSEKGNSAISYEAIQKVLPTVSTNESRRFACGIFIDNDVIVTTDGKRLTKYKINETGIKDVIFKKSTADLIVSVKKDFVIGFKDEIFNFSNNELSLMILSNRLEANFPPYNAVIPDESGYNTVINIDKKELSDAYKEIEINLKKVQKEAIVFNENWLEIRDVATDEIVYQKPFNFLLTNDLKFAINFKFLKEMLNVNNEPKLLLKNNQSTIIAYDKYDSNFYEIIMPMTV